jgi:mannosyl-glycoproteinendo-beta-N-acetylglucosami dase
MTKKEFIQTYKPFALESERKTGISHLFTLAQAALESAWGERGVGNNFFGIKVPKKFVSSTPNQKKQLLLTTEVLSSPTPNPQQFPKIISISKRTDGKWLYRVQDWFRKYDTPEECFTDHAQFFFINKRYAKALEVKADPYKFAEEVAKVGYATAPNYATILKDVIKTIENNS